MKENTIKILKQKLGYTLVAFLPVVKWKIKCYEDAHYDTYWFFIITFMNVNLFPLNMIIFLLLNAPRCPKETNTFLIATMYKEWNDMDAHMLIFCNKSIGVSCEYLYIYDTLSAPARRLQMVM